MNEQNKGLNSEIEPISDEQAKNLEEYLKIVNDFAEYEKDVKEFNSSNIQDEYRVFKYKFVKQIEEPKPIEISLEEAKEIIAKEKGVNVEQVNLNFNIK